MTYRILRTGLASMLLIGSLAACSSPPLEEKDRATVIAQCEKSMANRDATAEQANKMCTCTADKLIAEKMSAVGMISKHGMEIMDGCAKAAGMGSMSAPAPGG